MDIPEASEPQEENSEQAGRQKRRRRKKIRFRKRVRVKKKKNTKKQLKKLFEQIIWTIVILVFLATIIFMILELQDQDGPRQNKRKSRVPTGIEWSLMKNPFDISLCFTIVKAKP